MTSINPDSDYIREVEYTYKDERYTVRDNGAIFRHPRIGKRLRSADNQWTFGIPNDKTGYMEIASVRVHRIVAFAFLGPPPNKEYVVDHIDTNKRNNRLENLRWVTKLENVLLNPITAKRIEMICGSVEAFLSDPSKYRDKFPEPNYQWMCTVSKNDAQISLERMTTWSKSNKRHSGGSLGEWIFNRTNSQNQQDESLPDIASKTKNALQRNWQIPSEFPCCPQEFTGEPILAYAEKLNVGLVFCHNDHYTSLVSKSAISEDKQSLFVMTESTEGKDAVKPWALAKITYENGMFVHTSLNSYFSQEGAEKQFCLEQGLDWSGGDSIDDFC
ncbi:MAG TPA: HNH endonuclease signature motif containing protein [Tenuifilaceae bacterium]|nr:HNH endonuclease signature motif containing protein [Tenuifilaceae bacterium]HPI44149.1 HNH endonuclease signature motif containing protein [Tenuifilaceae bacterium]HPN22863.1 HNH endonuclease signature motif containing protein [Tenuifilaceae bacterium]